MFKLTYNFPSIYYRSKYEHNSKLTSLTSNTLGNQIVTCSDNGKIQIWKYKVLFVDIYRL